MTLALALLLAAAPARALTDDEVPRIPTRFELPGTGSEDVEGENPYGGRPHEELRAVILSSAPVRERRLALQAWPGHETPFFDWPGIERDLSLVEAAMAMPPGAWRRFVVASRIDSTFATIRGSVEFRPTQREWPAAWARAEELRDRCMKDADPLLAEYCERFDPKLPPKEWREVKELALQHLDGLDGFFKTFGEGGKEGLEATATMRKLGQTIEDSQKTVADKLIEAGPKDKTLLTAAEIASVAVSVRRTAEARNSATWGNLVVRSANEGFEDVKGAPRMQPVPIHWGWPDFKPLLAASGRTEAPKP